MRTYKEVICKTCGKIFLKLPIQIKRTNHNFCSYLCSGKHKNKKIKYSCPICCKIFYKNLFKAKLYKTHYCSQKCKALHQNKQIKKNCVHCKNPFKVFYRDKDKISYCSRKCVGLSKTTSKMISCKKCGLNIVRQQCAIKKAKNCFCSQICKAQYYGWRPLLAAKSIKRSKLEKWLEEKLRTEYPKLKILYNDRNIIKSELDFYIPSLQVAIELNGPFHYKPIFGKKKLKYIQNNDKKKQKICAQKGIFLKRFKIPTNTSQKFKNTLLGHIFQIIDTYNT